MNNDTDDTLRDHYDFSNGERGKYADRFKKGAKLVLLDPDIAEAYPTAKSVNSALRELLAQQSNPRSN